MKEIFDKLVTIIDHCSDNRNNISALIFIAENFPDVVSKIKAYDDTKIKEDVYNYMLTVFSSEKFIKGEFGIDLSPEKRQEIATIILDSKLKKD